jgi:hypothetical protein
LLKGLSSALIIANGANKADFMPKIVRVPSKVEGRAS